MEKQTRASESSSGHAPEQEAPAEDTALLARRRLLKLGAYVPPAIVGMAVLGSFSDPAFASKHGHGTVGSCMPSACRPCIDEKDDDDFAKKQKDHFHCEIEKEKKKRRDKRKKHKKHKKHKSS